MPFFEHESPHPQSPVLSNHTSAEVSFSNEELSRHAPHSLASNIAYDSGDFSSSVQSFMDNSQMFGRVRASIEGLPPRSGSHLFICPIAAWAFSDRHPQQTRSNLHEDWRHRPTRIYKSCLADLRPQYDHINRQQHCVLFPTLLSFRPHFRKRKDLRVVKNTLNQKTDENGARVAGSDLQTQLRMHPPRVLIFSMTRLF